MDKIESFSNKKIGISSYIAIISTLVSLFTLVITIMEAVPVIFKFKEQTNISRFAPYVSSNTQFLIYTLFGLIGISVTVVLTYFLYRRNERKQILIIYSHEDLAFVEKLKYNLKEKNFNVLIDRDIIKSGENWTQAINDAINKVDEIIMVVSENSKSSDMFQSELGTVIAHKRSASVYSVFKDTSVKDNFSPKFKNENTIDFSHDFQLATDKLSALLRETLEKQIGQ